MSNRPDIQQHPVRSEKEAWAVFAAPCYAQAGEQCGFSRSCYR